MPGAYQTARRKTETHMQASSLWMRRTRLNKTEARKCVALQEGRGNHLAWKHTTKVSATNTCRFCNQQSEEVAHLLGGCTSTPYELTKRRHDDVVRDIIKITNRHLGLNARIPKTETVTHREWENKRFLVQTDRRFLIPNELNILPDIVVVDKKRKLLQIFKIAVTTDSLVSAKAKEKYDKYNSVVPKIQTLHPGFVIEVIPIIIGQLGIVTESSLLSLRRFIAILKAYKEELNEGKPRLHKIGRIIDFAPRTKQGPTLTKSERKLIGTLQIPAIAGSIRIYNNRMKEVNKV